MRPRSLTTSRPTFAHLAVRILPADSHRSEGDRRDSDSSPLVRAEAMRRLADPAAKDLLLKALESDDPFVQQAARQGLRHSLKTGELDRARRLKGSRAGQRLGLLLDPARIGSPGGTGALAELPGRPRSRASGSRRSSGSASIGSTEFRPQLLAAARPRARRRESLFEATLAALERLDGKTRRPRGRNGRRGLHRRSLERPPNAARPSCSAA